MRNFVKLYKISNDTHIIDVGNTPFNWGLIDLTPDVTLINIEGEEWERPRMRLIVYDGNKLPFDDETFDFCYSNSVIEHVGPQQQINKFAKEIRRIAPAYYVQTPNRHFFVEPHFICLFIHWLPFKIKRKVMRHFSLWGLTERPSQEEIDHELEAIHLLTLQEMRELFPDATILRERVFGMTKSIIAIRTK